MIEDFVLGELFRGPGGLSLGAKGANVKETTISHGWASDYHRDTCNTFIKNIRPTEPDTVYHKDISKLDIESLSKINAFAHGFPCNDFSLVGKPKRI